MSKKNIYNILSKINNPYHDPYKSTDIRGITGVSAYNPYGDLNVDDDNYSLFKNQYKEHKFTRVNLISKLRDYVEDEKVYEFRLRNTIDIIFMIAVLESVNTECFNLNLERYIKLNCPDTFSFHLTELPFNVIDGNNVHSIININEYPGYYANGIRILKAIKASGINLKINYKDIFASNSIIQIELSEIELELIENELNYEDGFKLHSKPLKNNKMEVILTNTNIVDAEYFKQRYDNRWILKLDTSCMVYDSTC
jgi:hypothetical protein